MDNKNEIFNDDLGEEYLKIVDEAEEKINISNYSDEEFKFFFENIAKTQRKCFDVGYSDLYLKDTNLCECLCANTLAHYRLIRFFKNTRAEMESIILDHTKKTKSDSLNILSLGSGGLLQDFILLLKLIKSGVKKINLITVESLKNSEALADFEFLSKKVAEIYQVELKHHHISCIEELNVDYKFDILHAIDYESFNYGKDYSSRKLFNRSETFESEGYVASIQMIKAANFLKDKNSLAIMSRGKGIISFSPLKINSHFNDFIDLNKIGCKHSEVSLFYINSDIGNLVLNLQYFVQAKRPVLINEEIIKKEDVSSVKTLLENYKIPYEITTEEASLTKIRQLNGIVVVVDYNVFDPLKNEAPTSQNMQLPNISTIRVDWNRAIQFRNKISAVQSYPSFSQTTKNYSSHKIQTMINELSVDNNIKRLLETPCEIRRARYYGFLKSQTVTVKEYITQLAQGDDQQRLKALGIINSIKSRSVESIKQNLAHRRDNYDLIGKTTGEKIYAALPDDILSAMALSK